MKTGVLLVGVGSPDEPTTPAIRRYLEEYFLDSILFPNLSMSQKIKLKRTILRKLSDALTDTYRRIWTAEGSPAIVCATAIRNSLAQELIARNSAVTHVELAMRFGNPSIENGLTQLKNFGCDEIIALMLFPQKTPAFNETCLQQIRNTAAQIKSATSWSPSIIEGDCYFDDSQYIDAVTQSLTDTKPLTNESKVLFVFQSIPCENSAQTFLYDKQVSQTTELVAQKLQLEKDNYAIAFQAKFENQKYVGPTSSFELLKQEWLGPQPSFVLANWVKSGAEDIRVVYPGFPCDCIETLIHLPNAAKSIVGDCMLVIDHVNAYYTFSPSLRNHPQHIAALANTITR